MLSKHHVIEYAQLITRGKQKKMPPIGINNAHEYFLF